jgi:hypothetical protein
LIVPSLELAQSIGRCAANFTDQPPVMIHCTCPHCRTPYDLEDELAGQKLRCATCSKAFLWSVPLKKSVPVGETPAPSQSGGGFGTFLLSVAVLGGIGFAGFKYLPWQGLLDGVGKKAGVVAKHKVPSGPPAERAANYEEALVRAKQTGKDIVVLQRGSDWNPLGESLYREVWLTDDFAHELGDKFILVAVDNPEVVGGRAVYGQCTAVKCGITGLSDIQIGSAAPLNLAKLTDAAAPMPPSEVTAVTSEGGATFTRRADGAWVASGANPGQDTLKVTLKVAQGGNVLRLDFPTDPSLPGEGPGRASNGNFAICEVESPQKFVAAWGSATEGRWGAWQAIDGIADKPDNLWNPSAHLHQRRTLLLAMGSKLPAGSEFTFTINSRSQWGQHVPGCLRAAVVPDETLASDIAAVSKAQLEQAKNEKFSWWDRTFCPRIALMDSKGRAVACENKPRLGLTAETMSNRVKQLREVREKRDALWARAENAQGPEKAELLRKSLDLLGFANWQGNEDCYKFVHEQIRAADPKDESGAVRWLGFSNDVKGGIPWTEPNWAKALDKKDLADADYQEALARIDKELKDPRNRVLDHERIQRMMIAKFHVYKRWPKHEDQMFEVQREIAAFDPDTFWGIGATGFIAMHKRSPIPMLTYGWAPGQMKPGVNTWNMTDTPYFFDHAGSYKFRLSHAGGKDVVKVKRIALLDGAKVLAEARPEADLGPAQKSLEVNLDFKDWHADHKVVLRAEIEAREGQTDNSGNFGIEPELLGPTGAGRVEQLDISALYDKLGATLTAEAAQGAAGIEKVLMDSTLQASLARYELIRTCSVSKVADIAGRPGGVAFLRQLFADRAWMESLLASDPADLPQSLENLFLLSQYTTDLGESLPQRVATALAMVWGKGNQYRLVDRYRDVLRAWHEGLLHASFEKLTVREMRWAVPTYGSAKDYQFLLDERQTTIGGYLGACWAIAYIDPNVYGDSVQGWAYIAPWTHYYGTGTGNRPFPAHRLVGGVCGTLSGYGSAVTQVHGVPSTTVGQPGHCAYVVRVGNDWPIGNCVSGPEVTGFTAPGWDGTGYGTAARLYEPVQADREAFMRAERITWLGRLKAANWQAAYELAIAAQPTNYTVWLEYIKAMEAAKDVTAQTWLDVGHRAARALAVCNEAGWALTMRCFDKALPGMTPTQRMEELLNINRDLRQDKWTRPLAYQINNVLNWQADRIGDPALAVAYFGKLLFTHYSQNPNNNWIFGNVLAWGANRFAGNPATAPLYIKELAAFFRSQGNGVDKSMLSNAIVTGIRKASEAGDLESYRLWSQMAAQMLSPVKPGDIHLNDAQAAAFPAYQSFPGQLLSKDGMLRTSSACEYDRPLSYAQLLSGGIGGWFDTNGEEKPWAEVQLPGDATLTGVVLVNRYEYNPSQEEFQWAAPIKLSVSTDGKAWTDLGVINKAEPVFRIDLQTRNVRARYVRIERIAEPGKPASKGRFHFRNFLVYGQKLY